MRRLFGEGVEGDGREGCDWVAAYLTWGRWKTGKPSLASGRW